MSSEIKQESKKDVSNPPGWRPQPFFSYTARNIQGIDYLNSQGGLAIEFRNNKFGEILVSGGQTARLSLWSTSSTTGFSTVPKFEADLITVRFVSSGRFQRKNVNNEQSAKAGYAVINNFGDMRSDQASANFESFGGTISRDVLAAGYLALEGKPLVSGLTFEPVVEIATPSLRALRQTFVALHRTMRNNAADLNLTYPLVEEIMVYQLLSAWPQRESSNPEVRTGSSRQIQFALNYIDSHLSEPITIAEIASAAGISVRSLQHSFRKELGTSPLGYIIDRRLDRTHADICRGGDLVSIKAVASRWGFIHMSEFSRRFKMRFGYLPSQAYQNKSSLG